LKEYFLPEGYALFLNSQKKSGVNVPGPEFELAIFLLRVCSKINVWSYIQSLLWTGHAVKGFEKEFQYLRTRSQRDRFVVAIETLRLDRFRETLLALYESLDNLTLWTLLAQRKRMSRLRRLSLGERYRMLLERWGVAKFHKLINKEWRNLMVLPERGVSVALIGIDGSGKSTIASELKKRFSWRVSSEVVYFGSKEIDKDLSTIKHVGGIFLGAIRKILALSRFQAGVIDVDLLRSSLNHLLNSFGRARQYRFFKRLLAQGKIALCDRFPFADLGSFADAEAIDSVKEGMKTGLARYIACVFSRIENRNYRYTVFPDLIIYLHADPQIAYRRKMQQPPEILKRKEGILRQSLKRAEIRSHVVRLDSDRTSIDDIVHASIMEIWNRI
jgi:thymidylate kinase